jgi:multidrug efflux pump subunit AcrA (membrane-fusion protein)
MQIALAAAELEFARAPQRLAELNLDYTEIKAPVNGRIGESKLFVGGLATKNSSEPLTLISPLEPIQVKVKIGEREYLNYIKKAIDQGERSRRAAELSFQLLLGDGSTYRGTILGVCVVPAFFVVFQRLSEWWQPLPAAVGAGVPAMVPAGDGSTGPAPEHTETPMPATMPAEDGAASQGPERTESPTGERR